MGTQAKFSPASGTGNRSLDAATTGTGSAISFHDCRQVTWSTTYPGTAPTTGTIVIEQAPSASYAGTWNMLASIDCSLLATGADGFGTYPGQTGFVRARFTVDSDQPVTVELNGLLN
jgi:hypothetical protein